jgi:hypothetical protein
MELSILLNVLVWVFAAALLLTVIVLVLPPGVPPEERQTDERWTWDT